MSLETLWRSRREMVPQNWKHEVVDDVEIMVSANGKHVMVKRGDEVREWEFAGKGTYEEAEPGRLKWVADTVKELKGEKNG